MQPLVDLEGQKLPLHNSHNIVDLKGLIRLLFRRMVRLVEFYLPSAEIHQFHFEVQGNLDFMRLFLGGSFWFV